MSGYTTNQRTAGSTLLTRFSVAASSVVGEFSALTLLPAEHVLHCFGYKTFIFFWRLSVRNNLLKKHTQLLGYSVLRIIDSRVNG